MDPDDLQARERANEARGDAQKSVPKANAAERHVSPDTTRSDRDDSGLFETGAVSGDTEPERQRDDSGLFQTGHVSPDTRPDKDKDHERETLAKQAATSPGTAAALAREQGAGLRAGRYGGDSVAPCAASMYRATSARGSGHPFERVHLCQSIARMPARISASRWPAACMHSSATRAASSASRCSSATSATRRSRSGEVTPEM